MFGPSTTTTGIPSIPGAFYINNFLETEEQWEVWVETTRMCHQRGSSKNTITGSLGPKVAVVLDLGSPPDWVHMCEQKLRDLRVFQEKESPRQVSVNFYHKPKTYRMVPHKDGEGKLGVIVSLGAYCTLEFYKRPRQKEGEKEEKETRKQGKKRLMSYKTPSTTEIFFDGVDTPDACVLLEPGSALCLTGESFFDWVHGISAREWDIVDPDLLDNYHLLRKDTKTAKCRAMQFPFLATADSPRPLADEDKLPHITLKEMQVKQFAKDPAAKSPGEEDSTTKHDGYVPRTSGKFAIERCQRVSIVLWP